MNAIPVPPPLSGPVLLVEDLRDVRDWLAGLVRELDPRADVRTAHDLASAGRLLDAGTAFGLALVDLGLPDGSGIELIRRLGREQPEAAVVVTTIYADDAHLFPALAAGAQGYLLKEQPPELLRWHLAQLAQGVPALSPAIARRVLEHFRRQDSEAPAQPAGPLVALTPRETEVLSLIGRGLRANEAARQLGLSESTVVTYVKNIYRKLGISSRAEAALEASRRGLA